MNDINRLPIKRLLKGTLASTDTFRGFAGAVLEQRLNFLKVIEVAHERRPT